MATPGFLDVLQERVGQNIPLIMRLAGIAQSCGFEMDF